MAKLWFNTTGILHDGIGLVLCDTCPCDESSSVFSDSSSGSSEPCGCCYTFLLQSSLDGGGLCGEPPGDNVCGCVEFVNYPTQVCSGQAWSLSFNLFISEDCAGDLENAVIEMPDGWLITNNGGGTVSGQTVTFSATANGSYTISGVIENFYTCEGSQVEIKGYVTPSQIERGVKLVYDCFCAEPCECPPQCFVAQEPYYVFDEQCEPPMTDTVWDVKFTFDPPIVCAGETTRVTISIKSKEDGLGYVSLQFNMETTGGFVQISNLTPYDPIEDSVWLGNISGFSNGNPFGIIYDYFADPLEKERIELVSFDLTMPEDGCNGDTITIGGIAGGQCQEQWFVELKCCDLGSSSQ